MCGIAGVLGHHGADLDHLVTRMASRLSHRGPDDHGVWMDAEAGVALGHRRLAIVDLSPAGHQPMLSATGRYVLVYNGEIYNFLALRRELEGLGHQFRGHSDTEIVLAAFERWGVEQALPRFAGMFAIACWDRTEHVMHLVRDRMGKKPFYLARFGQAVLFASELKALHAWPGFAPTIDRQALALYMRHNYIPAPYTIYSEVRKLLPASLLSVTRGDLDEPGLPLRRMHAYWSVRDMAEHGQGECLSLSDAEAVAHLDGTLRLAVRERMISDVPLGAFLSGGIDSSAVVALMQAQSDRPVKTFTIGFDVPGYNEAQQAKAVAKHLGTEHTELYVTPEEAQSVIPLLPTMYDEPFADSSQIPTYLVAKLARQHVTVALSGDGGDETFAGYNRHFQATRLAQLYRVPALYRESAAGLLRAVSPSTWDGLLGRFGLLMRGKSATGLSGDRLHKLASVLAMSDSMAMYRQFVSHWDEPSELVVGGHEPPTILSDPSIHASLDEITHKLMWLDTVTYLPDDILVKIDRASMAVSLEARCPLLDHRVVELAWQLPLRMKVRDGEGKWILRRVLERYVPRALFERPKMGFGIPIDAWLRGPLREWAEALLDESRLRREGLLRPEPIRQRWAEHLSGTRNWSYHIWDVLMLQAWLEAWHPHPLARTEQLAA